LRTIPIEAYSRPDLILIYAGISSYISPTQGLQDADGGVLAHIIDLSTSHGVGSPAYTNDKQVFHTDQGVDVVALFALETAKEGGISRISSSWRVYNELAATRPDLVNVLAQNWDIDQ
jgi:Taurine catabolism dioxygenase TauD, TfdA family